MCVCRCDFGCLRLHLWDMVQPPAELLVLGFACTDSCACSLGRHDHTSMTAEGFAFCLLLCVSRVSSRNFAHLVQVLKYRE